MPLVFKECAAGGGGGFSPGCGAKGVEGLQRPGRQGRPSGCPGPTGPVASSLRLRDGGDTRTRAHLLPPLLPAATRALLQDIALVLALVLPLPFALPASPRRGLRGRHGSAGPGRRPPRKPSPRSRSPWPSARQPNLGAQQSSRCEPSSAPGIGRYGLAADPREELPRPSGAASAGRCWSVARPRAAEPRPGHAPSPRPLLLPPKAPPRRDAPLKGTAHS